MLCQKRMLWSRWPEIAMLPSDAICAVAFVKRASGLGRPAVQPERPALHRSRVGCGALRLLAAHASLQTAVARMRGKKEKKGKKEALLRLAALS